MLRNGTAGRGKWEREIRKEKREWLILAKGNEEEDV